MAKETKWTQAAHREEVLADEIYAKTREEVEILYDLIVENGVVLDAPTVQTSIRNVQILAENWIIRQYAARKLRNPE